MQKSDDKNKWANTFCEFMEIESARVPPELLENVRSSILNALNPSGWFVFLKTSLIYLTVGLLTLFFCPQFGISFTSHLGIMPFLMKFGETVCMLGCGAIFAGTSLLVASILLKPEEIRVLRENQILHLTSLATLSLGSFLCLGAEIFEAISLIWMLGAILGGALSLELGWKIRKFSLTVRST